jgi:hypothetical protein
MGAVPRIRSAAEVPGGDPVYIESLDLEEYLDKVGALLEKTLHALVHAAEKAALAHTEPFVDVLK